MNGHGTETIGVGLLGYAFMGRAHSSAYQRLVSLTPAPPLLPRLVSIAGRDESAVAEVARRYGYTRWTSNWRELVDDPEIQLVDNSGPNNVHAEPTIAAAEAGKHVICEKPLGRDAEESFEMWQRVAATGVAHMCAFNYRFIPAVRLARELLEAGELGEIHHFRARYLQEWGSTDEDLWRFDRELAGSGALGDLGSHIIDLARYLVGEVTAVAGVTATFHPRHQVDDAFAATCHFEGGAIGTLEASRFAHGRKNALSWEINGSRGSLAFELERLNELQVSDERGEFRTVLVTEPNHPFMSWWWPPGHTIGWEHTFVHELDHMLGAIAGRNSIEPHGATFEDGYRAAEVCDAIVRSAKAGTSAVIRDRDSEPATLSSQRTRRREA